jgi:hypothetical protein
MRFNSLIWSTVIVVSLAVAFLFTIDKTGPERAGSIFGGAIGLIIWPAVITGIVIGIGQLVKNPPSETTRRIVFLCTWGLTVFGLLVQAPARSAVSREQAIQDCIKAAKDSAGRNVEKIMDLRKYCDCAVGKFFKKRIDSSMVEQIKDRNSPVFNEIIMTCAKSAMLDTNKGSVIGLAEADTVPVLNTPHGIKARLKIGGEDYYFLFDSGASDIMVSDDLEKEMKEKGLITEYIADMDYQMANGETITCRRAYVSDIQLGNFLVTKSIVAFYDGDIEYLLGKSFMDHFSSWSFSKDNSHLILHK